MVILSSVIVTHIVFKRARAFAPFRFHDQLKTSASRLFSIFVHSVVSRKRTWNGLQEFRGRPKANTSLGMICPVSVPALMRRVESFELWMGITRASTEETASSFLRREREGSRMSGSSESISLSLPENNGTSTIMNTSTFPAHALRLRRPSRRS